MDDSLGEVTRLLIEMEERKQDAAPRLFELLYRELHRMAQNRLRNERSDHTLQATALVHETYLRLVEPQQQWQNRYHFFAVASTVMRRVLVDHARAKHAAKRPGSQQRVNLDEALLLTNDRYDDIIALDRALERLSQMDSRQGQIVELRYFGGLTSGEVAEVLKVSPITVQRDWAVAKAWLHAELTGRPLAS